MCVLCESHVFVCVHVCVCMCVCVCVCVCVCMCVCVCVLCGVFYLYPFLHSRTSWLLSGLTIHFAQPDAMKGSLLNTLQVTILQHLCHIPNHLSYLHQEGKPTCFVGVPHVWEKYSRKELSCSRSQTCGPFKGFVVGRSKVGIAYLYHVCFCGHVWSRINSESVASLDCMGGGGGGGVS